MSRTFRRKNQQHEYSWVLKDWDNFLRGCVPFTIAQNPLLDVKQLRSFIQMRRSLLRVQRHVGIGGRLSTDAAPKTIG